MKNIIKKIVSLVLFGLFFLPIITFAKTDKVDIYLFYGDGCPHCAQLENFLITYNEMNNDIVIHKYEVWYDEDSQEKLKKVQELMDNKSNGVPYLVIGNNVILGYMEESTPEYITHAINYYKNVKYVDRVGILLGVKEDTGEVADPNIKYIPGKHEENQTSEKSYSEKVEELNASSFLKKVIKGSPLVITSIVIGFIDGINVCAMWILLYLISMLLSIKKKKRRWIIGISFILASAIVYFLFLVSWLNLAMFLDKIIFVRIGIGLISVCVGAYSMIKFVNTINDNSCEIVNPERREKLIDKITRIVKEKSFFVAVLGTIVLAASVNLIELMCSLGLPVLFGEVLAINNVSNAGKIIYSIIYCLFFVIDDIIIFVIAMKTLEIKAISNKFGKYVHLIGGIIMFIIGVLMVIKPNWLMLNF